MWCVLMCGSLLRFSDRHSGCSNTNEESSTGIIIIWDKWLDVPEGSRHFIMGRLPSMAGRSRWRFLNKVSRLAQWVSKHFETSFSRESESHPIVVKFWVTAVGIEEPGGYWWAAADWVCCFILQPWWCKARAVCRIRVVNTKFCGFQGCLRRRKLE